MRIQGETPTYSGIFEGRSFIYKIESCPGSNTCPTDFTFPTHSSQILISDPFVDAVGSSKQPRDWDLGIIRGKLNGISIHRSQSPS